MFINKKSLHLRRNVHRAHVEPIPAKEEVVEVEEPKKSKKNNKKVETIVPIEENA